MTNKKLTYGPIVFFNPSVEIIGPALGGFQFRTEVNDKIILLPGYGYNHVDAIFEGKEKVWQNRDIDEVVGIKKSAYRGIQFVFNQEVTYSQKENCELNLLHILSRGNNEAIYSRGSIDAVFTRDGTQLYELKSLSIKDYL